LRPCGEDQFAPHHYGQTTRRCPVDYVVEDRGYKTPCWTWQLKITKFGYGAIKFNRKMLHAHRFYYEQYRGPIQKTIDGCRAEVDHLCRNRDCVNPEHMEIVAQPENVRRGLVAHVDRTKLESMQRRYINGESQRQIARDFGVQQSCISRILKAQRWRGLVSAVETRSPIKISPAQVVEIRQRQKTGETQRSIAKAFGLGQSQISRIIRGESWAIATTKAS
jgi:transposase